MSAPIESPPPYFYAEQRGLRARVWSDDRLHDDGRALTFERELPGARELKASDPSNAIGSGSLTLQLSDDDSGFVRGGHIIQVQAWNRTTATWAGGMLWRVEGRNRKTVGLPSTRTSRIAGRGVAADFKTCPTYPHGGLGQTPWGDQRTFGWAAPELDTSASPWVAAHVRAVQGADNVPPPGGLSGFPYTWPNPLSQWLWAQAPIGPGPVYDPDGICYFQYRFSTTDPVDATIFVTADDLFVAALDGIPLIDFREAAGDAADSTYYRRVKIPAGNHTFAIKAENVPRPGNPANSGLINVACTYDVPGDALFTGGTSTRRYLFTTSGINVNTPQIGGYIQGWRALPYPATPPGMNPGEILLLLLSEAQARGELIGWGVSFNDLVDSLSAAWPSQIPDFSVPVGASFMDVLNKLVSDGWIDWGIEPNSLVLNVWAQGTRGANQPLAAYTEGDNIEELEHDEKWGGNRTGLLFRWAEGYSAVGAGPVTEFLNVGDAPDLTEATRRAQTNLDRLDDESTGIVLKGRPIGPNATPWLGFRVGDTIPVPGPSGVVADYYVSQIDVSEEGERGVPAWTTQFVSRRRFAEQQAARLAARAIPGGLAGRTDSVAGSAPNQEQGGVLSLEKLTYNLPGRADTADEFAVSAGSPGEATSGPDRVPRRVHLLRATLDATDGTTGTSIVDFYVNGYLAITLDLTGTDTEVVDTFGSGVTFGGNLVPNWYIEVDPSQRLHVVLRNGPGDHQNMVLTVMGIPVI